MEEKDFVEEWADYVLSNKRKEEKPQVKMYQLLDTKYFLNTYIKYFHEIGSESQALENKSLMNHNSFLDIYIKYFHEVGEKIKLDC